jgi:hypothetical protein
MLGPYRSLLEAELDDMIDPSLPRMYEIRPPSPTLSIWDDFTDQNTDFLRTTLNPDFVPTMVNGTLRLST